MQDYLLNETESQDAEIIDIYINWENFKTAFRTIYGELNKKKITKL